MPRCEKCQRDFETEEGFIQHNKDRHGVGKISKHEMKEQKKREKEDNQKSASDKQSRKKNMKLAGIAIVVVLALAGIGYFISNSPKTQDNKYIVDGIECSSMEQAVFHIHVHLDVFVDGQPSTVPASIGIPNNCLFWLHTHDTTGVIHIEAPSYRVFNFGQFLDIWSNSDVAKIPEGLPVAYVNGKQVDDYRNINLNAHDEIAIVYGNPPASIPSVYNFPPGE
jgi:hypothetical protein